MGRWKAEDPTPEARLAGKGDRIPSAYLRIARINVAGKSGKKNVGLTRGEISQEMGLPIGHPEVWKASMDRAGLLKEYLAELERLRLEGPKGTG